MKTRNIFILVVLLAVIAAACSSTPGGGGGLQSADEIVEGLQLQGIEAVSGEQLEVDLFSVPATIIHAAGDSIQVYEYPDEAAAEADAALVDASGSTVGTSQPFWVDVPHFFKSGRLIVLYVGSNESILSALEAILGPQFAGR